MSTTAASRSICTTRASAAHASRCGHWHGSARGEAPPCPRRRWRPASPRNAWRLWTNGSMPSRKTSRPPRCGIWTVYDRPPMTPTDQPRRVAGPVVCGCCHAGPVRAAAHTRGARSQHSGATPRKATATRDAAPATGVRGYSPPPPAVSPIRGLIDFHTHSAPDVFGRAVDDDELAALAAARQMEAVVFKSHVALTADRAWLARKHVPGVKVFGGITLNGAVGGINAQAVEWMWRMQGGHGRVVWFPTFDGDHHVRRAGTSPSGIRVVDDKGEVLPAVRDVLKVCARERLVVQTGHSSAEQALAIITAAREEGCDRIVVTHAQFDVVGMTQTQMKQAASLGAKMELCALMMLVGPDSPLEWMRHSTRIPLADTAARVRAVGAQHFVLGTDLGQTGNPTPADGLQMFVAGLQAEGITREQIQAMGREVPGALLTG